MYGFGLDTDLLEYCSDELRRQISMRGFIFERLKVSHDAHKEAVEEVAARYVV